MPLSTFDVVDVAHDYKDPRHLSSVSNVPNRILFWILMTYGETQPSDETMVLLKDIVVSAECC
jgi:hypothetical protein